MKKIIMIFLGFGLTAYGMSYTKFKKHTKKHAKTLQSQALNVKQVEVENTITLRTPNPTLDVEVGRYKPDFSGAEYGYSVSASQKVRTNSYYNALQSTAEAKTLLSKAYVYEGKAAYMKKVEDTYTGYVYESKLLAILKEEYTLSKKMTHVAKERYVNGSETKVAYLQAKTQTLNLKTQMHTTKQKMNSLYYMLLAMGGFSKNVSLSKKFIYSVSSKLGGRHKLSSQQKILLAKEKLYASQLSMNESRFNSYDVIAGVEKEPDQSILRVGISIALPLRHNKEEERALNRLKMQQLQLDRGALALNIKSQKKMRNAAIRELQHQYAALRALKKEQHTLSNLLTEGYKIAQGSLFELMLAKNKLIQTRKSLIQTQKEINHQKIELRLLKGNYND
jgi:outer membrane protein TolC